MSFKLLNFFKGIAVGIANIVAGLSGSTIAVITNIYDAMLDVFSNIIAHPVKTIKKHWIFILGMITGLVGGVILLSKLFDIIPFFTSCLFAGIVLAGTIPLAKGLAKPKYYHIIALVISFVLIIAIPFLTSKSPKDNLELNFLNIVTLFFLGILSAVAMIMPGLSGSLILLDFGYYTTILDMLTDLASRLIHFNFQGISTNLVLILVFAIGDVIGLVLGAKVIKMLLIKAKDLMNYIIFGLVSGSFIAMLYVSYKLELTEPNLDGKVFIWEYFVAVLIIAVGFGIGLALNMYLKKKEDQKMDEIKLETFIDLAYQKEDEFKTLLKKLCSYKSVLEEFKEGDIAPFGKENKEALEYILDVAKKDGFNVLNQDNYAGHISFGEGNETLGILAHLDVVPAVGNWDHDPFDMVEKDSKLIARGVNDDKGPLVASYIAIKMLRELGVKPNKEIRLIMGCDEESGSRCLAHYFKYNKMPEVGFSPDACFPCINGEKAGCGFFIEGDLKDDILTYMYAGERFNIVPDSACMKLSKDLSKEYNEFLTKNGYKGKVEDDTYYAYGLAAHAMSPEQGVNAAYILFEFLNQYASSSLSKFMHDYVNFEHFGNKLGINVYHEEMKHLTMNMGIVRIEEGMVKLGFDCRVPVEGHDLIMREKIEEALKDTGLKLNMHGMGKIHYVPANSDLVKTLVKAYKDVTKDEVHGAYTIGGGTYAKFIDNAVAFGPQIPGREDVDHQANEYIYIDDYLKTIAIYAKAIYDLVK